MKVLWLLLICALGSCAGGFKDIDRRVELYMFDASESIGAVSPPNSELDPSSDDSSSLVTNPETFNPSAQNLQFVPAANLDENKIEQSLNKAAENLEHSSLLLTLQGALLWAETNSREMEFAQYDYLSSTLSLLKELHLWGPRFFNSIRSDLTADSTGGLYDTSLLVVNDFNVTQRLENGGVVSAGALTTVAKSIHASSTQNSSDSSIELALEIPILRGSGAVAREGLIQAKRSLVYAARSYERFRRTFYRDIVGDYLSLVVQKQSLENAQRGVDSLRQLATRQVALYESGRTRLYDSADAENQALAAVASLSQSWERYRLALDRFKIRIGWPVDSVIQVAAASIGVVPPEVDVSKSVQDALGLRLDLQNEKNRVEDSQRLVENAINSLLPDFKFTASAAMDSEQDKPARFSGKDVDYLAGLSLSLPLDREKERITVRQQQILLERAKRNYRESKDGVAVSVRSSLRNIEVYQFTLNLQERNVTIAKLGLDSINADPDRVSVLDQTRAISDLQSAQDARDSAKRDLEVAILDYLLQAGRLRVGNGGELLLFTQPQE